MKQPGHAKVGTHPGRPTAHEPPDTMQSRHGAAKKKLVKHKIGSKHKERHTTATMHPPAEGHRSASQVMGGGAALRPNLAGMQQGAMHGYVMP